MVDAKSDYPAACNAVEKVLLHSSWLPRGGLEAVRGALEAAGVQVHAGRGEGGGEGGKFMFTQEGASRPALRCSI